MKYGVRTSKGYNKWLYKRKLNLKNQLPKNPVGIDGQDDITKGINLSEVRI